MSDLTDFLLARIAENEMLLSATRPGWSGPEMAGAVEGSDTVLVDPSWLRAEMDAQRRIVAMHDGGKVKDRPIFGGRLNLIDRRGCQCGDAPPCRTLALLALPYADHPDWREEWRP